MLYEAIGFIDGEAVIRLSPDDQLVQIQHKFPPRSIFVDPFRPKRSISEANIDITGFKEALTTVGGSSERFIIARIDINKRKDKLSPVQIKLLDEGRPYSIALDLFDDVPDAPETETVIFHVLRRTQTTYSVLSITGLLKDAKLANDENVVTMLDLLGFTEIMRSHTIDEVEKKLSTGLDFALEYMRVMSKQALVFSNDNDILNINSKEFDTVEYALFADTVIIYPIEKRYMPLEHLCKATVLVIDLCMTTEEWLFRGGIELGSFRAYPERSRFLGRAIVKAHELEISQDWAGAIIGEAVVSQFPDEVKSLKSKGILVDWEVPIKTPGGIVRKPSTALNWCHYSGGFSDRRRPVLEKLLHLAPLYAKPKIAATLEFLNAMETNGLASAESRTSTAIGLKGKQT